MQVALTVIEPGEAPAVLSVAAAPALETVPPLAFQSATETGTPSGLVQLADRFTVSPAGTLIGLAETDSVGGFLGAGFMMKSAEQLTSLLKPAPRNPPTLSVSA